MIYNQKAYELGSKRSAIRELFEYGKQRAAVIGAENVYDFSLGNPTVPAPDCVDATIRRLTEELDCIKLHGYTSAQGDVETRTAIAEFLNKTHGTHFEANDFYMGTLTERISKKREIESLESQINILEINEPKLKNFAMRQIVDISYESTLKYYNTQEKIKELLKEIEKREKVACQAANNQKKQ